MSELAPFLSSPEPSPAMVAVAQSRFEAGLPVIIPGICTTAFATDLARLMPQLSWERSLVVRTSPDGVEQVREEQFEITDPGQRFSRHDRAIGIDVALDGKGGLDDTALRTLRRLFALSVATPLLGQWIARLCGTVPLHACGMEFARYRRDDFIAPHTDIHSGRVCHILIYLDPLANDASGGELCHGSRGGEYTVVPPLFNFGVILPLRSHFEHWVRPWTASHPGRLTVSLGYAADHPQTGGR